MYIDEDFMNDVGLGEMPENEKQEFMKHAEEELEVRVGQKIGALLTDEQLDEFESIQDMDEAAAWLDQHAPNFREVVASVYANFKNELLSERQRILD